MVVPAPWDFCQELFDKKIKLIVEEVGGTESPLLFLTNTKHLNKVLNKERKRQEKPVVEYVENFRMQVAKEKEYKAGRSSTKPFHFKNLLAYVRANYDVHINEAGLEADDAMCIYQFSRLKDGHTDTVICSRDKDVRQCPGWHYSWECGKQASIGPLFVDELGFLEKRKDGKIWGVGSKFFYYQLLVGDAVDNIGGIKGRGPVFAFNLLKDATTVRQCYELVGELFVKTYGDDWKTHFREMADLLWMVRELDENGEKVKWKPPQRLNTETSG